MDFIFGSFAEWMGVLDNRPGSTHCSLTPAEWKLALDAAGYPDTLLLTSSGSSVAHMAIISQGALSPAVESSTLPLSTPASSSSSPLQYFAAETAPSPNNNVELDIPEITTDSLALKTTVDDLHVSLPSNSELVNISSSTPLVGSGLNDGLTIMRCFSAGGEVDLVRFLSGLDSTKPHVIWLYTNTGESNTTLIGLVRSIRHEFSLWKVMMVLFHPSWDQSQQESFIYRQLMSLKWVDAEVLVDEKGRIHVPRVVVAPAPPQIEARNDKPVQFDESRIWRAFPAPLGPEDVEITVAFMSLSPAFPKCSEFSGKVTAVGSKVCSDSFLGKTYVSFVIVSCIC
jgi:fatty acid synthase, animal type